VDNQSSRLVQVVSTMATHKDRSGSERLEVERRNL